MAQGQGTLRIRLGLSCLDQPSERAAKRLVEAFRTQWIQLQQALPVTQHPLQSDAAVEHSIRIAPAGLVLSQSLTAVDPIGQ